MRSSTTSYASRIHRFRLPRVCVPVVGSDAPTMIERAESVVRDNPFLELRLDYLSQPAAALPKLKNFLEMHPEATVIATCRRAVNGGKFKGSVAAELAVLLKAADVGFPLVDIELQSAKSLKTDQLRGLTDRVGLIISYHDFRATKKLEEPFAEMSKYPADFYKVVSTATNLSDNVVMMKFLEANSAKHEMVGLCMGEQGIISRVLGVRAGSIFTFGAAKSGEETAPGQVLFNELRDIYRIDNVDAATQVYGVAGDPVEHSLSPIMMNAAFRREAVNAVYLSLHAKSLKDLLACVRDIPIRGLSITMPYKQDIVEALENSDALTRQIGACNTLVRSLDGKLYGFNTDVGGIVAPLEQRLHLAGARILVIGAGGVGTGGSLRIESQGRRGLYHQPHSGKSAEAGAASEGEIPETRRGRQDHVRRDHQCNSRGHGQRQAVSAGGQRAQHQVRVRPGLHPRRDQADQDGARQEHSGHIRAWRCSSSRVPGNLRSGRANLLPSPRWVTS